jgi:hypothetical protein
MRPLGILVMILAMATVACGGDDTGTTTAVTSTAGTTSTTTATSATTGTSTTSTTAAPSTTAIPGALTIMPIGDSITSSQRNWSTYRCYLDALLTEAGVLFDFVGSLSAPAFGEPYGCPNAFDEDHEGWWGLRVDQVIGRVTPSVENLQPDVALIHLGTNDIDQGQGPESTAAELESLITGLQAVSPDITILVAQIIPCDPGPVAAAGTDCSEDLPALNNLIAGFADLSTDESRVVVVDMYTGFTLDDLQDGRHPNDTGNQIMARRWMAALQDAGLL